MNKIKLAGIIIIGLFIGVSIVSGIGSINESYEDHIDKFFLFRTNDSNDLNLLDTGKTYNVPEIVHKNDLGIENDSDIAFSITYDQLKELREEYSIIILDVHDIDDAVSCCNGVEGSVVVTLFDLSCRYCIEEELRSYKYIVVYSDNISLRKKAVNLLRSDNYTVFELTEISSQQLPQEIQIRGIMNDHYDIIHLNATNTKMGVYEREGRIIRLFGQGLSHGSNPIESAELFINDTADILGVNPEDLHVSHVQPIMYDLEKQTYKFIGVYYDQYNNGTPVFNSRLVLLLRNEIHYPLVLASVDLRDLQSFNNDLESKQLNPLQGITSALNDAPSLVNFSEPELVIWAGVDDMIVDPAISYTFIADNGMPADGSKPEKYLFVTDATTGDILYKENMILFVDVTGNVQGKATQGNAADSCEDELPEVFKWARVNIGGSIAYTDADGNFIIPNSGSSSVVVESRLRGQWFRVFNYIGADSVLSLTVTPPGPANFMHNEQNNNEYIRAEVNGYVQANIVRDFVLQYNPSYPGLTQNEFPVYVNRNDGYCPGNAWYDYSSINFCHSGGGYPNTAWSTIIHHEYGHHLVNMGGSGQGAYGEGMSDTIGMLITDDPGIGYGFFGNCDEPLRTGDNTMQYPCSGSIHYCGQLLSGCIWSTRNELVITKPDTYHDIISNLAINSILLHTGTSIDPSITIDFLTLDDDNGNIYDGTPHYFEIAAGFGAHNMPAPPLDLLSFNFPDGLPLHVSPVGGSTVRVIVNPIAGTPQPGTGVFHYNTGGEWQQTPMTQIQSNVYDAVFPGTDCLHTISYYFSAQDTIGQTQYSPDNAPIETYSTVSSSYAQTLFMDDFETDKGWLVENSEGLADGAWERGVPVGGGDRGDPPTDYDGSGQCYLTANRYGNSDVDDGYTWLISPTFDLSTWGNAKIHYAVWYTNNYGGRPNEDYFRVYLSNDNGSNWVLANEIGPETPQPESWYEYEIMIGDYLTLNDQMKIIFEASDLPGQGSVVEAGIDSIYLVGYSCENIVDFTWMPLIPTIQDLIQFTDTSTVFDGVIVNYSWNFGDGNISFQQHPIHQYGNPDAYTVCLTVKYNDNTTDLVCKSVQVYLDAEQIDVAQLISDRDFRLKPGWNAAQEFVPSFSVLSRVELYMTKFASPSGDVTFEIREDSASGSVVFEGVVSPSDVPAFPTYAWVSVEVGGVVVVPGETYVIVLRDAVGATEWDCLLWGFHRSAPYGSGGPYTDGWFWFQKKFQPYWYPSTDWDYTFRTYGY